jgi:NADH:ubiquinone oxidoreductase subunit E
LKFLAFFAFVWYNQKCLYTTIDIFYERIDDKMKITVCIGSSCHIKGSRQVVDQLQELITANNVEDKVKLGGTFCLGKCQEGVCVMVDDSFHSVSPETVDDFFAKEVLAKI